MKPTVFLLAAGLSVLALGLVDSGALARPPYGTSVNDFCSPAQPYTGDCALCHGAGFSTNTAAARAYLAEDLAYFCPADPVTTDDDGDGFTEVQGDCDDRNPAIHPDAREVCGNSADENCDGVAEACAPSPTCPDADQDGFADALCGGADCDDENPAIHPGAVEIVDNGADDNCNGMGDEARGTCPEGGVFTIKRAIYSVEERTLLVEGISTVGAATKVWDTDSGALLAGGVPVEGGLWAVSIPRASLVPQRLTVENDRGCVSHREVRGSPSPQRVGNSAGKGATSPRATAPNDSAGSSSPSGPNQTTWRTAATASASPTTPPLPRTGASP